MFDPNFKPDFQENRAAWEKFSKGLSLFLQYYAFEQSEKYKEGKFIMEIAYLEQKFPQEKVQ